MKKLVAVIFPVLLSACSAPQQQSTVPLDMKTVEEYQQRVSNARTNTRSDHWDLNKKEVEPKIVVMEHRYPKIRPSVYYGSHHYGYGIGY